MLREELRKWLLSQGADVAGFAAAEAFRGAPSGARPEDVLPGARAVISIAVRVPRAALNPANRRLATGVWNMANAELCRLAYQVSRLLEDRGYNAVPVSPFLPVDITGKDGLSGDISHKHAAALAGLGRIGSSGLLITPRFGPRVRLATVATDAALEPDPLLEEDVCRGCRGDCAAACPAGAIGPDGKLDKIRCLDTYQAFGGRRLLRWLRELIAAGSAEARLKMLKYPRMLEVLELHQFARVGGVSCAECMRVCPIGKG